MASEKFRPSRPWILLAFCLLVWWVLPTVFKSFAHLTFHELQAPVWTMTAKIRDLQSYWSEKMHSKHELIEANRDLARFNASHGLTHSENVALRDEVRRLEELLDLPQLPDYEPMIARVARRSLSSWSHFLIIQKGGKDGIIDGAAVINKYGVIGRVRTVYATTSIVELVSSPTFRVAARFSIDARPITYQGMTNPGFTRPTGQAANVPTDIQVEEGEKLELVSSRLGGVFPDGLPIGVVRKLEPGTEGLFLRAEVELPESLHAIQELVVLIPLKSFTHHES